MKKLIAILLTLACLLALIACDNAVEDDEYDGKLDQEKGEPFAEPLILLESGGKMTKPYECFAWGESWNGGGWTSVDGVRASWKLEKMKDKIPQITYSDDFKIHYREDVEFRSLEVYNGDFDNICQATEENIPVYLTAGVYYLVIEVKKQGEYIKEQDKFEASGYECVYKFEILNEEEIDFKFSRAHIGKFKDYSLNADKFDSDDGVIHLPIFELEFPEELSQFKKDFGGENVYDYGWDEVPSFNEVTKEYDDEFFAENSLILVYVSASSGSYRFGVKNVHCDGTKFVAYIAQTNRPGDVTDDMADWFITFEVKKSDIENVTEFDAELVEREK